MKNLYLLSTIKAMVVFGIVLFSTSSCNNDDETETSGGQQVYFEYYHFSDVWHSDAILLEGFIINQNGEVGTFESTDRPSDWKFPTDDNYITEQNMQYNLSKITILPKKIQLNELEKYIQKIYSMEEGNYTEKKPYMADAGNKVIICYKYDATTKKYKSILLDETGDYAQTNKDPKAIEIISWMIGIEESIDSYKK